MAMRRRCIQCPGVRVPCARPRDSPISIIHCVFCPMYNAFRYGFSPERHPRQWDAITSFMQPGRACGSDGFRLFGQSAAAARPPASEKPQTGERPRKRRAIRKSGRDVVPARVLQNGAPAVPWDQPGRTAACRQSAPLFTGCFGARRLSPLSGGASSKDYFNDSTKPAPRRLPDRKLTLWRKTPCKIVYSAIFLRAAFSFCPLCATIRL